jgi:ATP phosphoribosyltransferase
VALLTADGALEAAPAMGCADIILDLVSTGGGDATMTLVTYIVTVL